MCTTQQNTDRYSGTHKGDSDFHGDPETPSPTGMPSAPISRTPVLEGELMAHIETLRSRILELEDENSSLQKKVARQSAPSQGDESLIHLLQIEVADLERQLYHAKAARKAAEENEAAAMERADMISAMLEQTVTTENDQE